MLNNNCILLGCLALAPDIYNIGLNKNSSALKLNTPISLKNK